MQKKQQNNSRLKDVIILSLILVIALLFRLYKINSPLADFHSWRQADTAAVARNFANNGFNLLEPKYDDFSNVQSGVENPQGYRMVEFPVYNAIVGYAYQTFPAVPIEVYGRLISIIFSLITISVIYFLLLKEVNRLTAIIASLLYATLPFFVFYSRVVLPETTALGFTFLSILTIYLYAQAAKGRKSILFLFLSTIFFALGLLIKPTVAFYGLVHLYVFFKKYKFATLKNPHFYLFFILSLAPFGLWRLHIQNYPTGVPKVDTLITFVNTPAGKENIFFRPAFFRWVFYERINSLILGGYLTVFFVLGVLAKHRKYILTALLISALGYLFVFQGGNVQHEYYQTLILPVIATFTALGINFAQKNYRLFVTPAITTLAVFFIFLFSWLISYYSIKDHYSYPEDLVKTANVLRDLTNKEDLVVTDTTGDTTLLYLADRKGAPSVYKDLGELKKSGYKYFFTYNKQVAEELKSETDYELIFESEKFIIFRL